MHNDIVPIKTILYYCNSIEEKIDMFGKDIEDYLDNPHYQHGCSFCIEQVGENVKRLSSELIARFPEIPWADFAGMRDIVAHGYHRIELDIVWSTITKDIPALKETCEKILLELETT
jgi:uncharacterized protein with HEPN domain